MIRQCALDVDILDWEMQDLSLENSKELEVYLLILKLIQCNDRIIKQSHVEYNIKEKRSIIIVYHCRFFNNILHTMIKISKYAARYFV